MSVSRLLQSSLLVVIAVFAGCGGATDPNRQPTKPFSVTITYKGTPVPDALVTFVNEKKDAAAHGKTDAQGVAKMTTYVDGDGAVLSKHQVGISKMETSGPVVADQESPAYVPPGENTPPTVVKSLIPAKYAQPALSGLTADVSASGPSDAKFELTD